MTRDNARAAHHGARRALHILQHIIDGTRRQPRARDHIDIAILPEDISRGLEVRLVVHEQKLRRVYGHYETNEGSERANAFGTAQPGRSWRERVFKAWETECNCRKRRPTILRTK